jgi:hypothetical protein
MSLSVPPPTASSLAHRAEIARLISPLRRVRPKVPFYDLAAHRIPTLWTLYRGLLRHAERENVRCLASSPAWCKGCSYTCIPGQMADSYSFQTEPTYNPGARRERAAHPRTQGKPTRGPAWYTHLHTYRLFTSGSTCSYVQNRAMRVLALSLIDTTV